MTPREVLDSCALWLVLVTRAGKDIELEALLPDTLPIPPALIDEVRRHKLELLAWLGWEEQADALVLESTRRLTAAWPDGCPLDGPEWQRHDDAINDAYRAQELHRLQHALHERERFALEVFDSYRKVRP